MDRSRSFSVGRAWRGAPWRCAGFLGVVTAGLANFGFAQPPARNSDKPGSAAAQPEPAPVRSDSVSTTVDEADGDPSLPRIVLLRGGRTVQGVVSRNGENYVVRKSTGEMFVPGAHVLFVGKDLRAVHRHLHDTLPGEVPADEHFALAKWCLEKQLLSECRLELLEVLRQDATREDARRMIARLDDVLVDPADKKPALTAADAEKAVLRAKYGVSDLQSLGGLTREQSRVFSTRVLPILLNNCSASGCHGGRGEDMFRLERLPVAESSRKLTVGRNLERVLAKVDRSQPGTSLLLTANTGPHARAGRVVIAGPKGIDQLRTVREWVESLSGSDFRPKSPGLLSPDGEALASHRSTEPGDSSESTRPASPDPASPSRPGSSTVDYDAVDYDAVALDSAKDAEAALVAPPRKSPFDPEEFNAGRDVPR